MSAAVPTTPPRRPFQPVYTATTTARVPGRAVSRAEGASTTRTDRGWRARAACVDSDPEIFFETAATGRTRARAVCATCPVWVDCLITSVINREADGIWAGFSDYQRRRIRQSITEAGHAVTPEQVRLWAQVASDAIPDEPERRGRGRPARAD